MPPACRRKGRERLQGTPPLSRSPRTRPCRRGRCRSRAKLLWLWTSSPSPMALSPRALPQPRRLPIKRRGAGSRLGPPSPGANVWRSWSPPQKNRRPLPLKLLGIPRSLLLLRWLENRRPPRLRQSPRLRRRLPRNRRLKRKARCGGCRWGHSRPKTLLPRCPGNCLNPGIRPPSCPALGSTGFGSKGGRRGRMRLRPYLGSVRRASPMLLSSLRLLHEAVRAFLSSG